MHASCTPSQEQQTQHQHYLSSLSNPAVVRPTGGNEKLNNKTKINRFLHPLKPQEVLANPACAEELTHFEKSEILAYPDIYYIGRIEAKQSQTQSAKNTTTMEEADEQQYVQYLSWGFRFFPLFRDTDREKGQLSTLIQYPSMDDSREI
jgi:hypothetical protein